MKKILLRQLLVAAIIGFSFSSAIANADTIIGGVTSSSGYQSFGSLTITSGGTASFSANGVTGSISADSGTGSYAATITLDTAIVSVASGNLTQSGTKTFRLIPPTSTSTTAGGTVTLGDGTKSLSITLSYASSSGGAAPSGSTGNYYVRTSGSDSQSGRTPGLAFRTIQHAASVAVSGEAIYVGAGTYAETVTPTNDGVIFVADTAGTATGDAGTVYVKPASNHGFVLNNRSNIVIYGFTIARDGDYTQAPDYYGICANTGASGVTRPLTVQNVEIYGFGRGVHGNGHNITVKTSSIHNIHYYAVINYNGELTVDTCQINNVGSLGVYLRDDSNATTPVSPAPRTLVVKSSTIQKCGDTGIYSDYTNLSLTAGIIGECGTGTRVKRGTYTEATSPQYVGNSYGLYLDGDKLQTDGTFAKLSLSGVSINGQSQRGIEATWYDVTFTNCTTNNNGDLGICVENGQLTATSCTANGNNRGFYCWYYKGTDGLWQKDANFNSGACKFTTCTANNNRAYGVQTYCTSTTFDGGTYQNNNWALWSTLGDFKWANSPSITGNWNGVGLSGNSWNRSSPLSCSISGLTLSGNKYQGLYTEYYNTTLTNCNFSNNTTGSSWTDQNGSARTDAQGWGVNIQFGAATMTNCTVTGCGTGGINLSDTDSTKVLPGFNHSLTGCTIQNNGSNGIAAYHYDYLDGNYDSATKGSLTVTNSTVSGHTSYGIQTQFTTLTLDNTQVTGGSNWGVMVYYGAFTNRNGSSITNNVNGLYLYGRWWKTVTNQRESITVSGLTLSGNTGLSLEIDYYNATLSNITISGSQTNWAMRLQYSSATISNLSISNCTYGLYFDDESWTKAYWYTNHSASGYSTGWFADWMNHLGIDPATAERTIGGLSISGGTFTNVINQTLYTKSWNRQFANDPANRKSNLHNLTLTNVSFTNCATSGNWTIESYCSLAKLSSVTITGAKNGLYQWWGDITLSGSLSIAGLGKSTSSKALMLDGPLKTSFTASEFANISLSNFSTAVHFSGWWPDMWSPTHGKMAINGVDFTRFTGMAYALQCDYLDLTATDCTISNNSSAGIYANYSSLNLTRCTITNNGSYGVYENDENYVKRYMADMATKYGGGYTTFKTQWSVDLPNLYGGNADGSRAMNNVSLTNCTVSGHAYGVYTASWNSSWERGLKSLSDPEWASYEHTLTLSNCTFDNNSSANVRTDRGKIVATGTNSSTNSAGNGIWIYQPVTASYSSGDLGTFTFSNNNVAIYISGWWPSIWQGTATKVSLSNLNLSNTKSKWLVVGGDYADFSLDACNFEGNGWGGAFWYSKFTAKNVTCANNPSGAIYLLDSDWVKRDDNTYINVQHVDSSHWYYTSRLVDLAWWGITPTKGRTMSNYSFESCTFTNNGQYGIWCSGWGGLTDYDYNPTANDYSLTLKNNTITGNTYFGVMMYNGRIVGSGLNSIQGASSASPLYCALGYYHSNHSTISAADIAAFSFRNISGWTMHFEGWWPDHVKGQIRSLTFQDVQLDDSTSNNGIHTVWYNTTFNNVTAKNYKSWALYTEIGPCKLVNCDLENNGGGLYTNDYNWFAMSNDSNKMNSSAADYNNWLTSYGVSAAMTDRALYSASVTGSKFLKNSSYGIQRWTWGAKTNTWSWDASSYAQVLQDSDSTLTVTDTTITGQWPTTGGYGILLYRGTLALAGAITITGYSNAIDLETPTMTTLDGSSISNASITGNGNGLVVNGDWHSRFSSTLSMPTFTVTNLTLSGNQTGLYSAYMNMKVTNCTASNNTSWGMYFAMGGASVSKSQLLENANGIYLYDYNWVKMDATTYATTPSNDWYHSSRLPEYNLWNIDASGAKWVPGNATFDTVTIRRSLTRANSSGYGIYGYTWNGNDWYGPRTIGLHANTWTIGNTTIQGHSQGINVSYGIVRSAGNNLFSEMQYALLLTEPGETTLDGNQMCKGVTFSNVGCHLYLYGNPYLPYGSYGTQAYTLQNVNFSNAQWLSLMAYYCNLTILNSSFNNSLGWGIYSQYASLTCNNVTSSNNTSGAVNYGDELWLQRYFYNFNKYGDRYTFIPSYKSWLPSYGIDVSQKLVTRPMCSFSFTNCKFANNGGTGIYGSTASILEDSQWDYDRQRAKHNLTLSDTTITGTVDSNGNPAGSNGVYTTHANLQASGSNVISNWSTGIYQVETPMLQLTGDVMNHIQLTNNYWALGFQGSQGEMLAQRREPLSLSGFDLSGNLCGAWFSYYNLTMNNVNIKDFQQQQGLNLAYCSLNATGVTISGNGSQGIYGTDTNFLRQYNYGYTTNPSAYSWYSSSWLPWLAYLGVDPTAARPMANYVLNGCSIVNSGTGGSWGIQTSCSGGKGAPLLSDSDFVDSNHTVSLSGCTISNFNNGIYTSFGTVIGAGASSIIGRGTGTGLYFESPSFTTYNGDNLTNIGISGFSNGLVFNGWWPRIMNGTPRGIAFSNITIPGGNSTGLYVAYCNVTLSNVQVSNCPGTGLYFAHCSLTADRVIASNNGNGLYWYDYNWLLEGWDSYSQQSLDTQYGITKDIADRNLFDVTITNSLFNGNSSGYGVQVWNRQKSYNNTYWLATNKRRSNITLTACEFSNNRTYGIYESNANQMDVTSSKINLNCAGGGYGIYCYGSPTLNFVQNQINNNSGWGIVNYGGNVMVKNCLMADNSSGLYFGPSNAQDSSLVSAQVWNTTIANTRSDYSLYQSDGTTTITNCILAGTGSTRYGLYRNGGVMTHNYNHVYGHTQNYVNETAGSAEIWQYAPKFLSATSGDYHLTKGSPAINQGTPATGVVTVDLDGINRPVDRKWDMGCYEFPNSVGVRWFHTWTEKNNAQ